MLPKSIPKSHQRTLPADIPQVNRASTALLKHISKTSDTNSKNLLPPSSQPIYLIITAKTNFTKRPTLKPTKIPLPHSLHPLNPSDPAAGLSICLITTDPHKTFKESIFNPTFPDKDLQKCIKKVIGLKKLKERYKTFEARRQLFAEHDVFLADDRAVTFLPKLLGKVFYGGTTKRPIPVNLSPKREKDKANNRFSVVVSKAKKPPGDTDRAIAPPAQIASELRKTLACTTASLSPSPTLAIRVGNSTFPAALLAANIEAIIEKMLEKHIPGGWRGLKAVHVKGTETMALPIWQAEELWIDEKQVLEEEEEKRIEARGEKKRIEGREKRGSKRKLLEGGSAEKDGKGKKKKKVEKDEGMSKEMKERREKLRRQLKGEKARIDVDQEVAVTA